MPSFCSSLQILPADCDLVSATTASIALLTLRLRENAMSERRSSPSPILLHRDFMHSEASRPLLAALWRGLLPCRRRAQACSRLDMLSKMQNCSFGQTSGGKPAGCRISVLMWLFRSWRKLYAENPVAVAMLWLGLGSLLAALLTWRDDPGSPTLPAL